MNKYIENKEKALEIIRNRRVTSPLYIMKELRLRDGEVENILKDLHIEGEIVLDEMGWVAS